MISIQLFQSIYVYASLVMVLVLSMIMQKKESCTCHIKAPSAMVALITTIVIGVLNGLNPLTIIIGLLLLSGVVGSVLFGKVGKISGGISYLVGFLILFAGFEMFKIKEIINMGFENISMFGALLAITIMFLKKQEHTIIAYIIGLSLFFLTAVISGMLPLVLGAILIVLSEIMLIYNNDYMETTLPEVSKKISYFSASLYSYGILLIPLALLL